ncbi:Uncharacterised protein [Mycobacteroides abscessus subsp. abscessus]|nr:Uncharacterised protein [Mycobacteroides abscessus subsp. abscessus]
MRFFAISCRSAEYVSSSAAGDLPETTCPSFQAMLNPSCRDTFIPCPALAEWVWQASPVMNTRGQRVPRSASSTSSKWSVSRWPTSYTECQATERTSRVYGVRMRLARSMISSMLVWRTRCSSSAGTSPRSTYMRTRCPPSRGMCRIEPCREEIAHLVRRSGKSVLASTSITPHAWLATSPSSFRPIARRTPERAPSQPMTYFAHTVRSSPARGPAVCFTRTTTGRSPSPCTSRPRNCTP